MAGRGGPPVAPPRYLQLPPTKPNLPGPFSGFQMTILAVRLAFESERCKKPSNPGTACGKPQPKALLLQPPWRLLQVQMFWHSTSFYESPKRPWQYSYEPGRLASRPYCTRHACHQSLLYYVAVSLATKQQSTSSSTAAISRLTGMLLETIRATYQTSYSLSWPLQDWSSSPDGVWKGGRLASTKELAAYST